MLIRHLLFALVMPLTLIACGGVEKPDTKPLEPVVSTVIAQALPGPYVDVADFCDKLGKKACRAEDRLLTLMSEHREPLRLRSGHVITLMPVASRDAVSQQAHLLVGVDGKLWALPQVNPYDPSTGLRVINLVMRFVQEEPEYMKDDMFRIVISSSREVSSGGECEHLEVSYYCKAGEVLHCAEVVTASALLDSIDTANTVRGAVLLPMIRGGQLLDVLDIGKLELGDKYDAERGAKMLAEGKHALVFP
jgi:hypothetical protein